MRISRINYLFVIVQTILLWNNLYSQNPLIMDQFTADPTARVFDGKVYVYPSHDILADENRGRIGWFCMEDYHVFSSENLTDWKDHGVVLSQNKVPWVDSNSYSMWAPDCINKNGKYYFYFPAMSRDTATRFRMRIGVAVSDHPFGPFSPQPKPIENVRGIDPNIFIDVDGQAYLYWAARDFYVAKLKENMLEIESEPVIISNLPETGLKEGPFVFERKGIYYLSYPHVKDSTEQLEYAIGDNPLGPFNVTGVIMDEFPICWTNHQSIVEYNDQWYLFYHHNDLSPNFDKNRSIRADSLFFNKDGTIQKVIPTFRGVGITDAKSKIQIDRYSEISNSGASIRFNDDQNTFEGWKTIFTHQNGWVKYNSVDFGKNDIKEISIRYRCISDVSLELKKSFDDQLIFVRLELIKNLDWEIKSFPVEHSEPGIHNLIVELINTGHVEIDWISFK